MEEYNLANKYRRLYEGLKNWKESNYHGTFQYTQRIDIPLVINNIVDYIDAMSNHNMYSIIVTSDISNKDSIKQKLIVKNNVGVFTIKEFIDYYNKNKKHYSSIDCSLLIIDNINSSYVESTKFLKALDNVRTSKILGITTKNITTNMVEFFDRYHIPIIDTITKNYALENGYISPSIVYNLSIEFTKEEKDLFVTYTDLIKSTISIFKGKAAMLNHDFKKLTHCKVNLLYDDFDLIKACVNGINYTNDLNDKTEHIHSDLIRNMLANVMGYSDTLDLSNDYNKQVEMYWKPDNILSRAKSFMEAIAKRQMLYANNKNKRDTLYNIIYKHEGKVIILNEDKSIIDYLETIPECMSWYKGISSRLVYDEYGRPYVYNSGAKKGEPKVFGEIGIKKEAIKNFQGNRAKAIATDKVANSNFDIEGLDLIICTSPYCNPFKTISDNKIESPYINKASIIIWLYMQDFIVDITDAKYMQSKEKEKLIERQKNINYDIMWVNSIDDIK